MNNPETSIIILNYNGTNSLNNILDSIHKISSPDSEIIIIDNSDRDKFISNNSKLKIIYSPKQKEKNYSVNLACREARGKYLLILDNDALITQEDIINNLTTLCKSYKDKVCFALVFRRQNSDVTTEYGGFFSRITFIDRKKKPIKDIDLKKIHLSLVGFPHGTGFFIPKTIWDQIGGYDEQFVFGGDDNTLGMKIYKFGYECRLFSSAINIHLGSLRSEEKPEYWKFLLYSQQSIIIKYYNFNNLIITFPVYALYCLYKTISLTLKKRNLGFVQNYLLSIKLLISNLRRTLTERKYFQKKFINSNDSFLNIKPPVI